MSSSPLIIELDEPKDFPARVRDCTHFRVHQVESEAPLFRVGIADLSCISHLTSTVTDIRRRFCRKINNVAAVRRVQDGGRDG
jgi:hypothetical protein